MSGELPPEAPLDGIAVIGMSCRFPGAPDIERFWQNLCAGTEHVSILSDEELAAAGIPAAVYGSPDYVKAASALEGVELFDAPLFDLTPREAALVDPAHRLFLECAWEALEGAGHDPARFAGRIGVYAGAATSYYAIHNLVKGHGLDGSVNPLQLLVSSDKDYLPTLASYKLNLRGPSVGVQTACSTGLVAVTLACQSLMTYQCDMALVGGAAVRVPHRAGYTFTPGGIQSPDGHCRAFDAAAAGTIFGSGVGVAVLRRLEDALADGDPVAAVIRGSAINNDGAAKVGFTAPSVRGQAEVIAMAQAMAEVSPETIGYIETHGTGTALGDPIEVAALEEVFRGRVPTRSCPIGSVKTNFGHLDTAAGIAGLIKTVLALQHRQIPQSLHFERPNPQIDFADSPFYVNTALTPWSGDRGPRRAGVSSFGVGGTNAHVILEEAPPGEPSGPARTWQVLPLSAASAAALETVAARLAGHLERHPDLDLADVAFTLQAGRRRLDHRRIVLCQEAGQAVRALRGLAPEQVASEICERGETPVAFVFPGQGSQYVGMSRDLYAAEAAYREPLDRCAELLFPHLGFDLRAVLFPPPGREAWAAERLAETATIQPVLFAVEYALAALWASWGVRPQALIGHSSGEYVAACLAGTFELRDALALVAARGRLMQELPEGGMLAIPLPEEEVAPLLDEELALAAVNGPAVCVVSGSREAIEGLRGRLAERGVESMRLRLAVASHSRRMEPILARFAAEVRKYALRPPAVPFVSCITGDWITAEEATAPDYWVRHMHQTVRFAAGLERLLADPARVLLEVGPGTSFGRQPRLSPGRAALPSLPHVNDRIDALPLALGSLGSLWLAGVEVDWQAFHAGERRRRVPLPTYPFERQRYWIGSEAAAPAAPQEARRAPAAALDRQQDLADWFHLPVWKQSMLPAEPWPPASAEHWLVLVDDGGGLGEAVATVLRRAGQRVTTAASAATFARLAEDAWAIDPERREDYGRLLVEGGIPARVVHLWSLTGSARLGEEALLGHGFYSLLFLAQAIGEISLEKPLALGVVADGLWRVSGQETLWPEKATLLGPARVIPWEYPDLSCRIVDVEAPAEPAALAALAERLVRELASGSEDRPVAYRGDRRWVQALEPVRLEARGDLAGRLRPRGSYLITGGLGGLGLAMAGFLARTVQARLTLVGRSPFPARQEWDEWLRRNGDGDPVSRRIHQIRVLEAAGGEVLVVSADVTVEDQVRQAIDRCVDAFGALDGIIHGAGAATGGTLQLKTREAAEAVMAPKVRGTRLLAAAVADRRLDFFVLLSSTAALSGVPGQVDYCAANAFLDAFAEAESARGRSVLAIDWGQWSSVGMVVASAAAGAGRPTAKPAEDRSAGGSLHPLLGRRVSATPAKDIYLAELAAGGHWLLDEHRVFGTPVLPGAAYLEMARRALGERGVDGPVEIRDLLFLEPLAVPEGDTRRVRTVLAREGEELTFTVESRSPAGAEEGWRQHATCRLLPLAGQSGRFAEQAEPPARSGPLTAAADGGGGEAVSWGAHWREVRKADLGGGWIALELPDALAHELAELPFHPALLDLATSGGAALLTGEGGLPLAYRRLEVLAPLTPRLYAQIERDATAASGNGVVSFDVAIRDEGGRLLIAAEGFSLKRGALESRERPRAADAAAPRDAAGDPRQPAVSGSLETEEAVPRMSPEEGIEAFQRVLGQVTVPQVVVLPTDPSAWRERLAAIRRGAAARRKRPAYDRPTLATPYAPPRHELEQQIAALWQEALGFERVGIHDNLFALGGNSLLAIQLLSQLRKMLAVELPVSAAFDIPTVAQLAAAVESARSAGQAQGGAGFHEPPPLQRRPAGAAAPLSFQQLRLWFIDQLESGSYFYNLSTAVRLDGRLEAPVLAAAAAEVARRHEILRTSFPLRGLEPVQAVAPPGLPIVLPVVDLSALPEVRREEESRRIEAGAARQIFDLAVGPLWRCLLVRQGEQRHVIVLTLHHIVADGRSIQLLVQELTVLYDALRRGRPSPFPELPIQYGDFATWQRLWLQGETLDAQLGYWRRQLAGAPPLLELPLDFPRPPVQRFEGARFDFKLPAETPARLRELARRQGCTPFMILLACYGTLLCHAAGSEDIVVGSNAGYRNWPETLEMIGFFANTLVLRTDFSGDPTFLELLDRVRGVALAAYANQHIPIDKLVEELRPARNLAYNPLLQVTFELAEWLDLEGQGPGTDLVVSPVHLKAERSQFDLSLTIIDSGATFFGQLEYKTSLFKGETIAWLVEQLKRIVAQVESRPDQRLSEIRRVLAAADEARLEALSSNLKEHNSQRLRKRLRRAEVVAVPGAEALPE